MRDLLLSILASITMTLLFIFCVMNKSIPYGTFVWFASGLVIFWVNTGKTLTMYNRYDIRPAIIYFFLGMIVLIGSTLLNIIEYLQDLEED